MRILFFYNSNEERGLTDSHAEAFGVGEIRVEEDHGQEAQGDESRFHSSCARFVGQGSIGAEWKKMREKRTIGNAASQSDQINLYAYWPDRTICYLRHLLLGQVLIANSLFWLMPSLTLRSNWALPLSIIHASYLICLLCAAIYFFVSYVCFAEEKKSSLIDLFPLGKVINSSSALLRKGKKFY